MTRTEDGRSFQSTTQGSSSRGDEWTTQRQTDITRVSQDVAQFETTRTTTTDSGKVITVEKAGTITRTDDGRSVEAQVDRTVQNPPATATTSSAAADRTAARTHKTQTAAQRSAVATESRRTAAGSGSRKESGAATSQRTSDSPQRRSAQRKDDDRETSRSRDRDDDRDNARSKSRRTRQN
jgi:hypothetical protein